MWSNYRPVGRMWPATAFSGARGSIQEKSSHLKFVEKCEVTSVSLNCLRWIKCICTRTVNNTFLCSISVFVLFYNPIRTQRPPLTLRWGTCAVWITSVLFSSAPGFVVLKSTSGAMNSAMPNKSVYAYGKHGLLKVAPETN